MPLHVATEQEHREIVQLLLQTGSHVNAVDRINRTPLMLAARGGQMSIASLLLQHGASLDACDNNGRKNMIKITTIHILVTIYNIACC